MDALFRQRKQGRYGFPRKCQPLPAQRQFFLRGIRIEGSRQTFPREGGAVFRVECRNAIPAEA